MWFLFNSTLYSNTHTIINRRVQRQQQGFQQKGRTFTYVLIVENDPTNYLQQLGHERTAEN